MRLADFVAGFPAVRLATADDNAPILDFFEQAPMRTRGFAVQYRRRPDFFRLLRYQSEHAFVLVSDDGGGGIGAVGSLSLRPGWLDGRPTTVGYLGDLRVKFDRGLARRWRRFFAALLAAAPEIDELSHCRHWLTTILDGNLPAQRALASGRPGMPTYSCLAAFTMRNLLLRWPRLIARRPRRAAGWRLHAAGPGDLAALTAFFEEENRRLPLGFRGELARRLSCWHGLSVADFVYATDDQGIVACVAPWSPASAKQTVVSRLPPMLQALGRVASWLPAPPLRLPAPGEALRTPYLTHLLFAGRLDDAARRAVFRAMLDHLFDRWQDAGPADWHCVALCDFDAWGLGAVLGGFLQQTVPISVYAVAPPAGHRPAVSPLPAGPPAFEMALV